MSLIGRMYHFLSWYLLTSTCDTKFAQPSFDFCFAFDKAGFNLDDNVTLLVVDAYRWWIWCGWKTDNILLLSFWPENPDDPIQREDPYPWKGNFVNCSSVPNDKTILFSIGINGFSLSKYFKWCHQRADTYGFLK